MQAHAQSTFAQPPRPPTPGKVCFFPGSSIGGTLERHPFSGLVHSAGKLLHTSKRIPTSMATVLLSR